MNQSIENLETLYKTGLNDTLRTQRILKGVDGVHILSELAQLKDTEEDMLPIMLNDNNVLNGFLYTIFPNLVLAGYELIRHRTRNDQELMAYDARMVKLLGAYHDTDITNVTYQQIRHTLHVIIATTESDELLERLVLNVHDTGYTRITKSDIINQMHYALETLYHILNEPLKDEENKALFDLQLDTRFIKPHAFAYNILAEMYKNVTVKWTPMSKPLKNQLTVFFNEAETDDVVQLIQCLVSVYSLNYLDEENSKTLPYVENEDSHEPFEQAIRYLDGTFLYNDGLMLHFAYLLNQLDEPKIKKHNWFKINQAFHETLFFEEMLTAFNTQNKKATLRYNIDLALAPVTQDNLYRITTLHPTSKNGTQLKKITCTHNLRIDNYDVVSTLTLNYGDSEDDAYVCVTFYKKDEDQKLAKITSELSGEVDPYYMTEDAQYAVIPLLVPEGWEEVFVKETVQNS